MMRTIASVLKGNPLALASAESTVEGARATLAKTEATACDAVTAVAMSGVELADAEGSYDADPSDANGRKVIKARDNLALAKLRQERAVKREAQAREALALAEAELERARADHRLEETARAEQRAASALEAALAGVQRMLDEALAASELATKASDERAAAATSLRALEQSMGRVEPDVALERAAWDATRESVAPIVAIIMTTEALQARGMTMLNTALDGQRDAAKLARELGGDAYLMPDRYAQALLTLARFERIPEEQRTDKGRHEAVSKVVNALAPYATHRYSMTLDAARLHLSHPHWQASQMLCAMK